MSVALLSLVVATLGVGEVTAVSALPRGTILTENMLDGGDTTALVGMSLRRPIYEGKTVTQADVELPALVTRQQTVTVRFRRNGLVMAMPGRALGRGSVNESVDVTLDGRRRPISAVVVDHGVVEVRR